MTTPAADTEDVSRLIHFFARYPDIRFSRISILNALDANGQTDNLDMAMVHLIDKGLVKSYSEHNVPYYGLTDDASLRLAVSNAFNPNREQWQGVLRESYGNN